MILIGGLVMGVNVDAMKRCEGLNVAARKANRKEETRVWRSLVVVGV